MAKNKKKFEVGSADPKPSKTSILSNGLAYDRDAASLSFNALSFLTEWRKFQLKTLVTGIIHIPAENYV
jgi:hypothetical protein